MKCPKCQHENPEDARFCNGCGHRLEVVCPECGKVNPPGSKFCNGCGRDLREGKKTPPIDFDQPQSYTPKFLADKILTSRSTIEGERKLVTVLFADVANYTSISEKLDPEEVHQIMDGCFKILMDEIHKYEGTINQFTGDGVMALFGAPVAHEDHAQRACYAALAIQNDIGAYGEKIKNDCGMDFQMRIGINSGHVIVGSIGDDLRMDYTAVGDTTNLASRMESTARPGTILISKNTQRLVRDFFELKSLGKIEVKGKEAPQEAFELIKSGEVETRIGASVAKGLTRFVGRKNSMPAAMDAFDKAGSGSGQVLALVGEAGVGKSRLLLEMIKRLPQDKIIYLEGQCLHYGGSMAYLPVLDILKSYFEIQDGDREFIIKKKMKERIYALDEKLSNILPSLQELLSLSADDEAFSQLEPRVKRERTFEALRDLFIRLSQEKTLVIAIEDLHWMDKTSEEFLDYLIGWLANSPILLILLYRPEYSHSWGSRSYYTKVGLDQLGVESSNELIKAILEEGEVAPELRQLILERAAGNPLFMEEFTHTLLENGSIERKDKQFVLNRTPSDIQVPDTVQGIIAARMDRLEDNLKRTMQVASVIGRDFAFRILQTITGMREELKAHLLNLQGLEFIYEKRLFPELEYIFKHALTQEVAYNSLLQKRRGEIHQRIGEAIEKIYAERLEEFYEMLAYHYLKGEALEKAYQYLKLSGGKAMKNYANHEAFRFYKDAIDVLAKMPETEANKKKQVEIRLSICRLMGILGFPEGSLDIIRDAIKVAREIGDEKGLALFSSRLGRYYMFTGDILQAIKYSEKAFHEAERRQDLDLLAPIGDELSVSYLYNGDILKVIEIATRVLNLIEKAQRERDFFGRPFNVYAELNGVYGISLALLGRFDEAKTVFKKALDFARDLNHLPSMGVTEALFSTFFDSLGDGKSVIKHAEAGINYYEKGGVDALLPAVITNLGRGYHLLGELKLARSHVERGLQLQEDIGVQMGLSSHYLSLSMIDLDLGELESAQVYIEKAMNHIQETNGKMYEGITWVLFGRILGKKDPPLFDRAEEYILKGIRILIEKELKPWASQGYLYLGDLYKDMGRKAEALEYLKKAEGMFQDMGMDYWLVRTQEALGRLGDY